MSGCQQRLPDICHSGEVLEDMREGAVYIWGRAVQAEETASTEAWDRHYLKNGKGARVGGLGRARGGHSC